MQSAASYIVSLLQLGVPRHVSAVDPVNLPSQQVGWLSKLRVKLDRSLSDARQVA